MSNALRMPTMGPQCPKVQRSKSLPTLAAKLIAATHAASLGASYTEWKRTDSVPLHAVQMTISRAFSAASLLNDASTILSNRRGVGAGVALGELVRDILAACYNVEQCWTALESSGGQPRFAKDLAFNFSELCETLDEVTGTALHATDLMAATKKAAKAA